LSNLAAYDTDSDYPQSGWGLTNTGPFINVQLGDYWAGMEDGARPDLAWEFWFCCGSQNTFVKTLESYAWPVRSGGVVPVPAAGVACPGPSRLLNGQ
jgi:hypothetical protein